MINNKQVIIVGAGISGLTAAYELNKAGYDVTVLESTNNVGGRMSTVVIDGYIIDVGAQFLSSGYTIIINMLKELEIEDIFAQTSNKFGIVKNGKIYSFNYQNPISIMTSGLYNLKQFIRLISGTLQLYKKTKSLSKSNYSEWHEFDTENTKSFCDKYYSEFITEYLFEPILEAFYFQNPEETSKALSIALQHFSINNCRTMTLKGGINQLPKKIATKLNIQYNSEVIEINKIHDKIEVRTTKETYITDNVIIATTSNIAKRLYKDVDAIENKLLDTKYSSTINVAIGLSDIVPQFKKHYGIIIPRKERQYIAAIAIERNKDNDRAYHGELLSVMLDGKAGKLLINSDENEIISKVVKELEVYYPDLSKKIKFTKLFRWQYAEPMSEIGRSKNIYTYRQQFNSKKGIYLAGDYMGMPFTEGAAESGYWIASKIITQNKSQ